MCGGRDFDDYTFLQDSILDVLFARGIKTGRDVLVIHGAAKGADSLADRFADRFEMDKLVFPAKWETYGKSAGYIRNKQMLDEGKPDLVIAFNGGKGTRMMCDLAQKSGVEVVFCLLAK